MRVSKLALLGCLVLLGCPAGEADEAADPPLSEPTRQERDSILGQSRIPGAGVVGRALESSATANERTEYVDSVQAQETRRP
jgi:hypothetical protein